MVPVKTNQNWLPSIFNDFFDNEWMSRANATAPAINVIELPALASLRQQRAYWKRLDTHLQTTVTVHTQ